MKKTKAPTIKPGTTLIHSIIILTGKNGFMAILHIRGPLLRCLELSGSAHSKRLIEGMGSDRVSPLHRLAGGYDGKKERKARLECDGQ